MDASFSRAVEAGLVGGLMTLEGLLEQAVAHAEDKGVDVQTLLEAQLFEDMFPFWRQIDRAASVARRTVDRLSGKELEGGDKPEANVAALRAHLHATIAHVRAADGAKIDATESSVLTAKLGKNPVQLTGGTYLTTFALPNFLFHVVTAYNILRHNGVALGKHGYLRPLIQQGIVNPNSKES